MPNNPFLGAEFGHNSELPKPAIVATPCAYSQPWYGIYVTDRTPELCGWAVFGGIVFGTACYGHAVAQLEQCPVMAGRTYEVRLFGGGE